MENVVREWLRRWTEKRDHNIRYEITGRKDGRWICQAFNAHDKPIGPSINVATPKEAWRIFMLLNGYAYEEPTQEIEEREKAS